MADPSTPGMYALIIVFICSSLIGLFACRIFESKEFRNEVEVPTIDTLSERGRTFRTTGDCKCVRSEARSKSIPVGAVFLASSEFPGNEGCETNFHILGYPSQFCRVSVH